MKAFKDEKGRLAQLDRAVLAVTCCYMLVVTWSNYDFQAIILLAAGLGIARCWIRRPYLQLNSRHIYFSAWFYLFMFITIFTNDVNSEYLRNLSDFRAHCLTTLLAAAVVFFFIREKERVRKLFPYLACSLIVNNAAAVYQHFQGVERVMGLTPRAEEFAAALVIVAPLCLFWLLTTETARGVYLVAVLSAIPAALFNGSYMMWAALAVAAFLILLLQVKEKKKCLVVGLLLLLSSAFAWPASLQADDKVVLVKLVGRENSVIWQNTLQVFTEHPVTGVGFGNYREAYYHTPYISAAAKAIAVRQAGNLYLQYLAEMGLFTLLTFLILMSYFVKESCRRWRQTKHPVTLCFLSITLAVLLHGLTDANLRFETGFSLYALVVVIYMIESGCVTYHDEKDSEEKWQW